MADIIKEQKQLYEMITFGRMCTNGLIPKQKRDVLRVITLFKEKRGRKIKIRACVYGRTQRSYI